MQIFKFASFLSVSSVVGFGLSICIAKIFGTSRSIEIYFAAIILIYNVDRFFSLGSLTEIFIPKYVRIKEKYSEEEAMKFFSSILTIFLILGVIATLLLLSYSEYLIEKVIKNFSIAETEQVTFFFKILLIILPLKLFNGLSMIPLRSNEKYNVHEKIGIILKVLTILFLIFLPKKYSLDILIYSLIISALLKFIVILILFNLYNYKFNFKLINNPYFNKEIFKTIIVSFSESVVYVFSYLLLLSALTGMSQGILAIYQYVSQIFGNLYPIIANSLSTIFLTEISKKNNQKNKTIVKNFLSKILFLSLIITIFAATSSKDFLTIIWGSNKFDSNSIHIAYYLLMLNIGSMLITLTDNFYQKFNIAKDLYIAQLIGKNIILLFSSILILKYYEQGYYILIFIGVAKAISSLIFSITLNYINNKDNFCFYRTKEIIKYLILTCLTIVLIICLFNNMNIFELNVVIIFLSKILLTFILIYLLNIVFKVFDIKKLFFKND